MAVLQRAATQALRGVRRGALGVVGRIDPDHLALLARRPARDVGRLVVVALLPMRFDPSHAHGVDATIELRLLHAAGGGHDPVTIQISDGRCRARPRAASSPDVAVAVRLDHLLQLVVGRASPRPMLSDGRLQVTGDVLLFMRFPAMFGGLA